MGAPLPLPRQGGTYGALYLSLTDTRQPGGPGRCRISEQPRRRGAAETQACGPAVARLQFGGVARAVPLTISYRRTTVQLLVVLALVPLCVVFGYTVAAMLDDGSVVY